jgi:coniferyl-aldehyde dehydrogenase
MISTICAQEEPWSEQASIMSRVFEAQRQAFELDRYPSADTRVERLMRLRKLIIDGQQDILDAVCLDFGHRSTEESRVAEIAGTIAAIDYAASKVHKWMRSRRRHTSIWFMPATNRVMPQPVGVVGIMAPWNYPVNLALVPLVSALAAGNRAMIKMSEMAPSTTKVLSQLMGSAFDESEIAITGGNAQDAAYFTSLAFDHLLFTGSAKVGRLVMAAAALNLTPLTLELGGKCPVIIDDDYSINEAARRVLWGKTFNAAQTCVAPDYVMVPRGKLNSFVEAISKHYATHFPDGALADSYTSTIDQHSYERLTTLVDTAKQSGATIHALEQPTARHAAARKFPLTLVINPPAGSRIMREEIFGPVLPVFTTLAIRRADGAVCWRTPCQVELQLTTSCCNSCRSTWPLVGLAPAASVAITAVKDSRLSLTSSLSSCSVVSVPSLDSSYSTLLTVKSLVALSR